MCEQERRSTAGANYRSISLHKSTTEYSPYAMQRSNTGNNASFTFESLPARRVREVRLNLLDAEKSTLMMFFCARLPPLSSVRIRHVELGETC